MLSADGVSAAGASVSMAAPARVAPTDFMFFSCPELRADDIPKAPDIRS
jgi:hypothetical protein